MDSSNSVWHVHVLTKMEVLIAQGYKARWHEVLDHKGDTFLY